MHEILDKNKKYYFSENLKKQLAQISYYPLTIIKAPSGFGKTTAIREYLNENLSYGAHEYWYTCLGESSSVTWSCICELISNINVKVADDLRNLKMPTKDTLNYMLSYIKKLQCNNETFIVVDNYQLINCDISHELIQVFSSHTNANLHMIFITQEFDSKLQPLINSENIHRIESVNFIFDRKGIVNLFHIRGYHLTEEEVDKIYISTEGWIAAIRLQMLSFIRTGSLTSPFDIELLVENTIWNNFDIEEQEFLLSVSVLASFTTHQAAIVTSQEILSSKIQKLLKSNDYFIKYFPDKGIYSIHSILLDYLKKRFNHGKSLKNQNEIYRKAGFAMTVSGQYSKAAEFYYKVKDFDAILSLPFRFEYLEQENGKNQYSFYKKIINECPDKILCKHPFTMIVFGYMTLMNGYDTEYKKLYELLKSVTQNEIAYNKDQFQRIYGEFQLLKSIGEFNDIAKMQEAHVRSLELLASPSEIVNTNMPSFFGGVSILNMLWRESGKLDDVIRYMKEGNLLYHKLTRGHRAGTCYAMMAETNLMRGNDKEAEIYCHRALYEAQNYNNIDIRLCSELLLVRISILRGDVKGYFDAMEKFKTFQNENSSIYVSRMVEYCMSIISLLLNFKDFVAPWFYTMEDIKNTVYAPVVPHAQLIHLLLLIQEKRYYEFYGICQHEIELANNTTEKVNYVMPQVYRLIFLAVVKRNNGDTLEAQKYLKEALSIALPDHVYLPFAQQECMVDFLDEINKHISEHYYTKNSNNFDIIKKLCKRQKKGVTLIRKAIQEDKSPLTPREREIALLAKERLTAKEIAEKLFISDMTVKATLRSVYSKLDIHSKTELNFKEF